MGHRVDSTDGGMGLLVQKVTSASNRPCDDEWGSSSLAGQPGGQICNGCAVSEG